jgi:hypothetical protein
MGHCHPVGALRCSRGRKSHPAKARRQAGRKPCVRRSDPGCGARGTEDAGRVWSPEMWIVVGQVKPTPCSGRKAAARPASGGAGWAPPRSEAGACISRGDLGTRETQHFPRRSRTWGTGVKNLQARQPVAIRRCRERRKGLLRGTGRRGTTEACRDGVLGVSATHSTEEGGEVRPKRPTGGKAKPGIPFWWKEPGERR